jgi:hypothetical protein
MSARRAGSNNVFRLLNVIRAVVPLLRLHGSGHILNISGMGGQVSFPLASIYHAANMPLKGYRNPWPRKWAGSESKSPSSSRVHSKLDIAGRSMTYAEPIAAYQFVYGTMTKRFEPTGDPARAAQAIEVDVRRVASRSVRMLSTWFARSSIQNSRSTSAGNL